MSPVTTRAPASWWSRRWIRALESLGATYPNPRLPRGRTLARNGAVRRLIVQPGKVTADVEQDRRTCQVALTLPVYSDEQWADGIRALAGQLQHAASLLEGRMPENIEDTLGLAEMVLFPRHGELASQCVCRDGGSPCAHGAAVHYAFAHALDDNPFLLPALRGRSKEQLLAELSMARGGGAPERDGFPAAGLPSVAGYFTRGRLSSIALHPQLPDDPARSLRRRGTPPGCTQDDAERLAAVVENAAAYSSRLLNGARNAPAPVERRTRAWNSSDRSPPTEGPTS